MSYLRIQSLGKRYGGVVALDSVSLDIAGAGIYGLIGPNGAGKTTLFDCLAGTTEPDQGQVWLWHAPFRSAASCPRKPV